MIYFISGHRNISNEEFMMHYPHLIYDALRDPDSKFVVGDYDGVDEKAQTFLIGKTKNLIVYHMNDKPMYNNGNWITKGGYVTDIERDTAMTNESNIDIAWIRNWKENTGTEQNVIRRSKK